MKAATATKERSVAKPIQTIAKTKPKTKALVISTGPKSFMQIYAEAVRDPKVSPEKMRDLKQVMTEQQWIEAMLAAQTEIGENTIIKSSWNPHTKSHYVTLEKLSTVIDPIARRHGFAMIFGMTDSPLDDHYRVTCDIAHRSGHVVHKETDVGMDVSGPKGGGNKSAAQGSGSSTSYAKRYLKTMIFNVNVVGEDNDGAGAKKVAALTQKQLDAFADLLDGNEPLTAKVLTAYQVKKLEDIPPAKFDEALARIKAALAVRPKPAAATA